MKKSARFLFETKQWSRLVWFQCFLLKIIPHKTSQRKLIEHDGTQSVAALKVSGARGSSNTIRIALVRGATARVTAASQRSGQGEGEGEGGVGTGRRWTSSSEATSNSASPICRLGNETTSEARLVCGCSVAVLAGPHNFDRSREIDFPAISGVSEREQVLSWRTK